MIDSAEVLTPEQRSKVAERWQKRIRRGTRPTHFRRGSGASGSGHPLRLPVFDPTAAALHRMQ